jgi:uncharacterized cupin superfamily protein
MTEDGLFVCKSLDMGDANIWTDEWDPAEEDWSGGGGRSKRLPRAAERPGLGATVYELDPGNFIVYHFHHAWEELLVVLRGTPTLRTPEGERVLAEGESVYFQLGAEGAHGLRNETDAPVRLLMASTLSSPEVCEYPDLGQITAQARTGSQTGDRLWLIHDVERGSDE